MVEVDGAYRTDDMALAAVLFASGFQYALERQSSTKAVWAFEPPEDSEERFDDLIDAYENHSVKVEPRSYLQEVARMRQELYKLLKVRPRQLPHAPSTADQPA